MQVTFVTQSSRTGDAVSYSPERLVNVFPEMGPSGAQGPVLLRAVLGKSSFATITTPIVRRMEFFSNRIYMVAGGRLWSIEEDGTATNHVEINDSELTTISENGTHVAIAAGNKYYTWDGATLLTPSGGRIALIGSVAHLDHYTIMTENNGDEFEWTTLNDPTTRNALFFATNESNNDKTLRVMVNGLYAWFMGEFSTEVWYNTGESGADAFTRLSGGALENGLLAATLVTKTETGLFFIGNDKVAYITLKGQFQAVSTGAVNQALSEEIPTHCFYYESRGHRFCCIRFLNRPAWCYDMSTGLWHERSSDVNLGAWDVVDTVNAWNKWYCATTEGTVYEMSTSNTDVTSALKRRMISSSLIMAGEQFSIPELELRGEFGEGDISRDVQIIFRLSEDGGRTWGPEITESAGDIGDRTIRVVLYALGSYRNFTIEVSITDAAELSIFSAANVTVS